MKNMIIIGTLFAIQSYASTVRIGFFEAGGLGRLLLESDNLMPVD